MKQACLFCLGITGCNLHSATCIVQAKSDAFDFGFPDLGQLQELTVWHDGSGFGSGWHLNYIEVHNIVTKQVEI